MRITVRVKTGARENAVKKIDEQSYLITVKARPIDGKANETVIKTLAEHFNTPPSSLRIHSGVTSRTKIIDVDREEP